METRFFRYAWRYSRRAQIAALLLVVASLPFYWASLDIPKAIVNDAIQGRAFASGATEAAIFKLNIALPSFLGGTQLLHFDGFRLTQVPYLFALSFLFLGLVLINGAFKYVINIQKGVLGERMLRRLRFDLFARVLQFRPEDVRATKSAEVASMIKDEVEPIGGFFGEAFITPAFLGTQAVTALAFILVQNFWLGIVALLVIGTQALVIPRLRREQIRLGRERQIKSRKLAGRIGEMVDAAPALHVYGVGPHARTEIGDRLGVLFHIRLLLFRRKFAVKYLNNLLAQVTPFVFYTLGGYLALKGRLDIGQLVAIIAAYRDLPSPIKELIDWDQQRADVIVKYDQVVSQFTRDVVLPLDHDDDVAIAANAPFTLVGLRVADRRGALQLDRLSLLISRPVHVAITGPSGSGRDILPKVLGRQITDYQGSAAIDGRELNQMADGVASRFIVYAGSEPFVMSGSIRENICFALRCAAPPEREQTDAIHRMRRAESLMTGNPTTTPHDDWIDYGLAGATGPEDLDRVILRALRIVHGYDEVFRLGVSGRPGHDMSEDIGERLIAARKAIHHRLASLGRDDLVEQFSPERFNASATLGENLAFGVPTDDRVGYETLSKIPYVRAILDAEALTEPLIRIGMRMAETALEVFPGLKPGHPLLERYSFIGPTEIEELSQLLGANVRKGETRRLPISLRNRLIGYALMYVEPRHRLDLVDNTLRARVLRARASFRKFLPSAYASFIEFYHPDKIIRTASISDNLLFGKIAFGAANAREQVTAVVNDVINENGLAGFVLDQGLAYEAGPGGRLLAPHLQMIVHLARAIMRRPDILILDGALAAFPSHEAETMLRSIKSAMEERTLIATFTTPPQAVEFDRIITFDGPRLAEDRTGPEEIEAPARPAGRDMEVEARG